MDSESEASLGLHNKTLSQNKQNPLIQREEWRVRHVDSLPTVRIVIFPVLIEETQKLKLQSDAIDQPLD